MLEYSIEYSFNYVANTQIKRGNTIVKQNEKWNDKRDKKKNKMIEKSSVRVYVTNSS